MCGRQMCNCNYKLSCKLSHLCWYSWVLGMAQLLKCLQWMHEDLIWNPQHSHRNCDSCTCDFTTGGTKMSFPAPLVLTGQQANQISQLQLQWDTLSQKLKWFPLASTIHICIHVLLNMHICIFKCTHLHEYVHIIYHTCTEILVPNLVWRSDSQVVLEMNFALI